MGTLRAMDALVFSVPLSAKSLGMGDAMAESAARSAKSVA